LDYGDTGYAKKTASPVLGTLDTSKNSQSRPS